MDRINRRRFFGCFTGMVSATAIAGIVASEANAGEYTYEYYRDVYGNGNWSWSEHGYSSFQQADQGARMACRLGTKVTYLGKFDSRGNLVERRILHC